MPPRYPPVARRSKPAGAGVLHAHRRMRRAPGRAGVRRRANPGSAAAGRGGRGRPHNREAPHDAARGPDRPRRLPRGRGPPRGRAGRLPHPGARRGPQFAPLPGERANASADFGTTALEQAEGESLDGRLARELPDDAPDVRPAEDPDRALRPVRAGPRHDAPTPTPAPTAPPTTSRRPPTPPWAARAPRRAPCTSPTADPLSPAARRTEGVSAPVRGGLARPRSVVYVWDRGSAGSRSRPGSRPGHRHVRPPAGPGTTSPRTAQR